MRTKYNEQTNVLKPLLPPRSLGLFARGVLFRRTRAREDFNLAIARRLFFLFSSLAAHALTAHALTAPATPVPENALSLLITEITDPNIAIARTTCASPESRPASPPRFSSRPAHT